LAARFLAFALNHHGKSDHASAEGFRTGALYAILAYTSWGLVPLYWKLLGQVPAVEVLCHRIIWSMVFLAGLLVFQKRKSELIQLWRSPKYMAALLVSTALVSFNWGFFIYSIHIDRVVEASLGYYINPLVNMLLGFVFLRERFNRAQKLAICLATIAVANFVWQFGQIPWISLGLAISFALYGLCRKLIAVTPIVGLWVETAIAAPIALAWVGYGVVTGTGHLGTSWLLTLLLVGGGVITSLPLIWFNHATQRLRLSTLGFFQYIGPSLQLLLGVFLYHEPFTTTHVITFTLIWIALVIYSLTALREQRSF
jgi:chloramphenicol-sensitive protein RarD